MFKFKLDDNHLLDWINCMMRYQRNVKFCEYYNKIGKKPKSFNLNQSHN